MLWLIDIDDTLSRPSSRRLARLNGRDHKCLAGASQAEIDAFMDPELMLHDEPTEYCERILRLSKTAQRLFFTGRCEKLRQTTVNWLERAGWHNPAGIMRPDDLIHLPATDIKLGELRNIKLDPHTILIDDDDRIRRAVAERFSNIIVMSPEEI